MLVSSGWFSWPKILLFPRLVARWLGTSLNVITITHTRGNVNKQQWEGLSGKYEPGQKKSHLVLGLFPNQIHAQVLEPRKTNICHGKIQTKKPGRMLVLIFSSCFHFFHFSSCFFLGKNRCQDGNLTRKLWRELNLAKARKFPCEKICGVISFLNVSQLLKKRLKKSLGSQTAWGRFKVAGTKGSFQNKFLVKVGILAQPAWQILTKRKIQRQRHTHTQTKTNTKCFQDPMYAIFIKSRGFKDLKYYIGFLWWQRQRQRHNFMHH